MVSRRIEEENSGGKTQLEKQKEPLVERKEEVRLKLSLDRAELQSILLATILGVLLQLPEQVRLWWGWGGEAVGGLALVVMECVGSYRLFPHLSHYLCLLGFAPATSTGQTQGNPDGKRKINS